MGVFSITAVDSATDTVTVPAHGLLTGDGFLGVYTEDGTLPAPLSGTADYWAIRVDANTIKLATSSANAMAGTAIDLTTNGSGTLQLVQGAPYRAPTIQTPLSQVKGTHLNQVYRALVAIWNLFTGQAQSIWASIRLLVPVELRSAAESNTKPLIAWRDAGGNSRSFVDHLGYPQGQFTTWEEHWRTAGATLPTGWSSVVTNAPTVTMTDPISSFPQRHLFISLPGAASTPSAIITPEYMLYLDNDRTVVYEQTIRTTTFSAGGTNYDFGFQFSNAGANDRFVIFRLTAGAGNWRCVRIGATTTNQDSGLAAAVNTTYRFKIEITGSSHNGLTAGTFRARFYINGVLRHTEDFSSPAADKIRLYQRSFSTTSGTGDAGVLFGRPRVVFNHMLAGDPV